MAQPTKFQLPDFEAKNKTLILKVNFKGIQNRDTKTMKFDPNATVEEVIVQLAILCEIGRSVKEMCLSPGTGEKKTDSFDIEKKLSELSLKTGDAVVFQQRSEEELKLREIMKAIDDVHERGRKAFSFREQVLVELPPYVKKLWNAQLLVRVDLSKNKLKTFPKEIGYLTQIVEFSATDNELESIPPEMGHLKKMQRLYLSNNKLKALPSEIGLCSSLVELNIRENCMKGLPRSLGNLFMEYLTNFQFFGNDLHETIPVSVLGEGPKAVGRWLRKQPETDDQKPNLVDLPPLQEKIVLEEDQRNYSEELKKNSLGARLAAAEEKKRNDGGSGSGGDSGSGGTQIFEFSDTDTNVMGMLSADGKASYETICVRLEKIQEAVKPSTPRRIQWATSISYMLNGRGDDPEKVSKLANILVGKEESVLLSNIEKLYNSALQGTGNAQPITAATTATATVPATASTVISNSSQDSVKPISSSTSAQSALASLQSIADQLDVLTKQTK